MKHLLTYVVKAWRDAGVSDQIIAKALRDAASEVHKGKFWPSDLK